MDELIYDDLIQRLEALAAEWRRRDREGSGSDAIYAGCADELERELQA